MSTPVEHECEVNRTATIRSTSHADTLTPAELRALKATATHAYRSEAASCLGISTSTLTHQLTPAYAKLGVDSIVEAMLVMGWVAVPDYA